MIDYFKDFSKIFYLHNVGVLVFCRRQRIDNTALQECRDTINDLKQIFILQYLDKCLFLPSAQPLGWVIFNCF